MRNLYTFVAGPKRHAEFFIDADGVEIVERTEAGLGGFFVDPPTMPGRAPDGGRIWSLEAVERELDFQLALRKDSSSPRPPAQWDEQGELPFPAIRRLTITTPEVAKSLPEALRRPGLHYLEGVVPPSRRNVEPPVVALDPGGGLADWQNRPQWLVRGTGQPVPVTTDPEDIDAVLLDTLDSRAIDWATKRPPAPVESLTVDPLRARTVGAASGVIDASLDGLADPGAFRTVYREADGAAMVHAEAARLGPREFRRRSHLSLGVAQRAATGKRISAKNIETALHALTRDVAPRRCALDGCEKPVPSARWQFCSKRHRDRAYRLRRQQDLGEPPAEVKTLMDDTPGHPTCAQCDTVLLGLAAIRGTCSRHTEGP